MGHTSSTLAKTGFSIAGAATGLPIGPVGEVLAIIIELCEAVPKNRHAARYLAVKCKALAHSLEPYEKLPVPHRTTSYRDDVFKCLRDVKDMMQKWAGKSWFHMLIHQGEFDADFEGCNDTIFSCLITFMTAAQLEGLVAQKKTEEWRKELEDSLAADHKDLIELFASPNFMQRVKESDLTKKEQRAVTTMLQRGLEEQDLLSEEEQKQIQINLHNLLQLSKQLPPNCQLNSGEVQWSGEVPAERSKKADMYKGRYLHSEDVRIKVIRSVNMKDQDVVKRIKREVELWAKIYEIDQGEHIIPFYGFYSPDGLCLALVSRWIDHGDVLEQLKKLDEVFNYKKLMHGIAEGIQVLHTMNPSIVHGSLRAKKILIGSKGKPLITDFALAKMEGNLITQTGGESDACRWSGPELFEFDAPATVSTKGDIYSFGMTMLELFTHEIPYANIKRNYQVIAKKQGKDGHGLPDRPVDERVVARGLDDGMWDLICRCCANEPEDRPKIEEVVTSLS